MPSDRDASISDAAFREALEHYTNLVQWERAWALNRSDTRPAYNEVADARDRVTEVDDVPE